MKDTIGIKAKPSLKDPPVKEREKVFQTTKVNSQKVRQWVNQDAKRSLFRKWEMDFRKKGNLRYST